MDLNWLMLSTLFGLFGLGFFLYGKKAQRLVPLLVGIALMVVPYFISNLWLMTGVCLAMTSLPWFLRER
jgi:hypothetical protein